MTTQTWTTSPDWVKFRDDASAPLDPVEPTAHQSRQLEAAVEVVEFSHRVATDADDYAHTNEIDWCEFDAELRQARSDLRRLHRLGILNRKRFNALRRKARYALKGSGVHLEGCCG